MMQSLVKFKDKKKGFTLVELIVVIAIIGILAAILMPKFFGFTDDARKSATISEAKSISALAENFYAANGVWPNVLTGTGGFKVQTDATKTTFATTVGSPIFSGTINIANGDPIANGSFTYLKDKYTATCENGNVK